MTREKLTVPWRLTEFKHITDMNMFCKVIIQLQMTRACKQNECNTRKKVILLDERAVSNIHTSYAGGILPESSYPGSSLSVSNAPSGIGASYAI